MQLCKDTTRGHTARVWRYHGVGQCRPCSWIACILSDGPCLSRSQHCENVIHFVEYRFRLKQHSPPDTSSPLRRFCFFPPRSLSLLYPSIRQRALHMAEKALMLALATSFTKGPSPSLSPASFWPRSSPNPPAVRPMLQATGTWQSMGKAKEAML